MDNQDNTLKSAAADILKGSGKHYEGRGPSKMILKESSLQEGKDIEQNIKALIENKSDISHIANSVARGMGTDTDLLEKVIQTLSEKLNSLAPEEDLRGALMRLM